VYTPCVAAAWQAAREGCWPSQDLIEGGGERGWGVKDL